MNGPTILRGDVQLQRTGNATTSTGYNSHQFNFTAQAWDTATKGVVSPTFQWRAEPINNNTASPSATWNLLTTNGVANAAETGLYFNGNGTIHFASDRHFPEPAQAQSPELPLAPDLPAVVLLERSPSI